MVAIAVGIVVLIILISGSWYLRKKWKKVVKKEMEKRDEIVSIDALRSDYTECEAKQSDSFICSDQKYVIPFFHVTFLGTTQARFELLVQKKKNVPLPIVWISSLGSPLVKSFSQC